MQREFIRKQHAIIYNDYLKRAFDFTIAMTGLILLSPLMVLIAILIKLESRGTIFYRGVRTGRYGEPFRIFKFRTMVMNAENLGGTSTAKNDARVTRIGGFLRRHKLDELPQLLDVVRGKMSLVGPRPEVEEYTSLYTTDEKVILQVRPGITDFASLELIQLGDILGDENPDEVYKHQIRPIKNQLRMKYVQEQSLVNDVRLLVKTVAQVARQ